MKKDSNDKDSGEKKYQEPNQVLKRIWGMAKKKLENFRTYLSEISLEDLAELTQMIGNEVNSAFISIGMIVAELRRRSKENNETIEVEVDNKIVVVSSSMSDKDEENLVTLIQKSVETGATVKYFRSTNSKNSKANSCQTSAGLEKIRDDVQGFQKELDQLKKRM